MSEEESLQSLLKNSGLENDMSLLFTDVNAVQAYVMESPRLPEIRGASISLIDIEKRIFGETGDWLAKNCLRPCPKIANVFPIYASGGTALSFVREEKADSTCKAKEALKTNKAKFILVLVVIL